MPNWGRILQKAGEGVIGGGFAGSMVPGVGTGLGALAGGLYGAYTGWQGGEEEDRADQYGQEAESVWKNNPYSASNPGLTALMAQQQGGIQRRYAGVAGGAQAELARRGMGGSSYGNSMMRNIALERARALSGNASYLTGQNYDKQAAWNKDAAGFYGGQQTLHQGRANDIYSDASDVMSGATSLAGWGQQNKLWAPTTTSIPPSGGLQSLALKRDRLSYPR